jgi:hypothetical protein
LFYVGDSVDGETILFDMKEKNEAVKELASVLANSKYLDTTAGIRTRSDRERKSHPEVPAFPHVIIETGAFSRADTLDAQHERERVEGLITKAGLSHTEDFFDLQESLRGGKVEILPDLDPEPEDIQIVKDLVTEIQDAVKALEKPVWPEPMDGEEGLISTGKNALDDEEQQCPPQGKPDSLGKGSAGDNM